MPYHSKDLCVTCYNKNLYTSNHSYRQRQQTLNKTRCLTVQGRFIHGKSAAKFRGWDWALDFSQYDLMLTQPCHYCLGPLNKTGIGLDRMNSSVGYLPGNVVPCCKECNRLKSNKLSYEEMLAVALVLRQHRSKGAA